MSSSKNRTRKLKGGQPLSKLLSTAVRGFASRPITALPVGAIAPVKTTFSATTFPFERPTAQAILAIQNRSLQKVYKELFKGSEYPTGKTEKEVKKLIIDTLKKEGRLLNSHALPTVVTSRAIRSEDGEIAADEEDLGVLSRREEEVTRQVGEKYTDSMEPSLTEESEVVGSLSDKVKKEEDRPVSDKELEKIVDDILKLNPIETLLYTLNLSKTVKLKKVTLINPEDLEDLRRLSRIEPNEEGYKQLNTQIADIISYTMRNKKDFDIKGFLKLFNNDRMLQLKHGIIRTYLLTNYELANDIFAEVINIVHINGFNEASLSGFLSKLKSDPKESLVYLQKLYSELSTIKLERLRASEKGGGWFKQRFFWNVIQYGSVGVVLILLFWLGIHDTWTAYIKVNQININALKSRVVDPVVEETQVIGKAIVDVVSKHIINPTKDALSEPVENYKKQYKNLTKPYRKKTMKNYLNDVSSFFTYKK